jgi:hypothetical protein
MYNVQKVTNSINKILLENLKERTGLTWSNCYHLKRDLDLKIVSQSIHLFQISELFGLDCDFPNVTMAHTASIHVFGMFCVINCMCCVILF